MIPKLASALVVTAALPFAVAVAHAQTVQSIFANAAQTGAQAPSDPQAYCVNSSADFYPYTGEPCKSGYQLGSGNCRKTNGRIVAVPREECLAQAGTVELPFEGGVRPAPFAPRR